MMKIRPRGESISVPSSENVGQYARQSPQCTHWLTPSTDSPCRLSGLAAVGCDAGVVSILSSSLVYRRTSAGGAPAPRRPAARTTLFIGAPRPAGPQPRDGLQRALPCL